MTLTIGAVNIENSSPSWTPRTETMSETLDFRSCLDYQIEIEKEMVLTVKMVGDSL